jgi:hypothetical protein
MLFGADLADGRDSTANQRGFHRFAGFFKFCLAQPRSKESQSQGLGHHRRNTGPIESAASKPAKTSKQDDDQNNEQNRSDRHGIISKFYVTLFISRLERAR